jgi:hypothetical protein
LISLVGANWNWYNPFGTGTPCCHCYENWYSKKSVHVQHWYDPHNYKNTPKSVKSLHIREPKKLEIKSTKHATKTTTIEEEMLQRDKLSPTSTQDETQKIKWFDPILLHKKAND